MREFWDERADEDAFFFVDNELSYGAPDLERFWARGTEIVDSILAITGAEIRPQDRLVEIGCGVGRITRELARRAAHVDALDVSARMLDSRRNTTARSATSAGFWGTASRCRESRTLRPTPASLTSSSNTSPVPRSPFRTSGRWDGCSDRAVGRRSRSRTPRGSTAGALCGSARLRPCARPFAAGLEVSPTPRGSVPPSTSAISGPPPLTAACRSRASPARARSSASCC